MSLEDIRIGQRSRSYVRRVSLGVAPLLIVPRNPARIHLTIAHSNTGINAAFAPASDAALTLQTGFGIISTTLAPLDFDIEVHKDMVTHDWFGIGSGAFDCLVVETILAP